MIHWVGKTTGGVTIYETDVENVALLLEELIDEGIISPYWEVGSQLGYWLSQANEEFGLVYARANVDELKRFNYRKLLQSMIQALFKNVTNKHMSKNSHINKLNSRMVHS